MTGANETSEAKAEAAEAAEAAETKAKTGKKNRQPKRLKIEDLQNRVKKRQTSDGYRGAEYSRIKWDTLRYDDEKQRQVIDIETVDADGKPDGGVRTIATSDLQHTRHTKDVAKMIQRARNNERRRLKRKLVAEDKSQN